MAGSIDGGRAAAARKLGVSVEHYVKQLEADRVWCTGHGRFCDRSAFGRNPARANGLRSSCNEALAEIAEERRAQRQAQKERASCT